MKKILVGVDGSPRQHAVLSAAIDLANKSGAKLVLLRAASVPTELPPEAYLMPEAELTKILEKRARLAVEEAASEVPKDVLGDLEIVIDDPWRAICRAATTHNVEMIVVGAHGYSVLERMLGTTASKVVNHADRSVLVVR